MMRVYLVLGMLLLALGAGQIGLRYEALPVRMATHFDLLGNPNGWAPKGRLFVLHFVVLAATYLTFAGLLVLSRRGGREYLRVPHVPNRKLWLSPPHETKARNLIERTMALIGLATLLFLLVIFEYVFRANLRDPVRLPPEMAFVVAAFVILVVGASVALSMRFSRPPGNSTLRTVLVLALAMTTSLGLVSCAARGAYPAARLGAEQTGVASYYADEFAGRPTANGEIFDPRKLSAAHKTLPFGTVVLVTNLDNGRTLRLRINDRGPFIPGRIIDVSEKAAEELGFKIAGIARVRIEIVSMGEGR